MKTKITVFWFRRDLRLKDNAGLFHALKGTTPVLPIFIFDKNILDKLEDKNDQRVQFIHKTIQVLKQEISNMGSDLRVFYTTPAEAFQILFNEYNLQEVITNKDYEPYAMVRDNEIRNLCKEKQISFKGCKDQVIFEENEIVKKDGKPYTVFTPYSKQWLMKFNDTAHSEPFPSEENLNNFFHINISSKMPSLSDMGFEENDSDYPPINVSQKIIESYHATRDFPALEGTSKLGIHFRFGTISIRDKVRKASKLNPTFLNELIWRDFYKMILFQFPHVTEGAFKPQYNQIEWSNNEKHFNAWCNGVTGYPIVDAGMRELNNTGYMHNRVRMIVASFLCKHLLIDWKWGEAYFAKKLLDFDLSANNGGWQWAAGSGCDAAPYFRIFNPYLQTERFDKERVYIKKWVPELGTSQYPEAIVEHKFARERALTTYKQGLTKQ
ncbi:DNA photolyase family protein [Bacteroidia bacterium]|nr:DNA photolyase family protein [Bacteroidia bacterium]